VVYIRSADTWRRSAPALVPSSRLSAKPAPH
jgi:hypothetical protein